MREKISACIICCNEEQNIRRCLDSVVWADEIVVVDSFSEDRTVAICREYTTRVYQHKWLGYIGQKNLIKDLATGPWILFLDADEEISGKLQDEIASQFETGANYEYAGFAFPRKVWFLGRWIRHGDWYPDRKLRLFRKELGTCSGQEPHDRTTVKGRVKALRHDMYHYTYDSLSDQLMTMDRFAAISARGYFRHDRPFRVSDVVLRPLVRFLRSYVFRLGFLDGLPGFVIATASAYSVLLKYAKLWELRLNASGKCIPPPDR